MAATAMLAKVAIPLGIGLVLLATRKGKAETRKESDRGISLARSAVSAMQRANGNDLDNAIQSFTIEGDSTTAGGLGFQRNRMTSRGTRGFTDHPTYDKDDVLKVDNREWATRLIQLEGRAKALDAWSEAYASIGAKNLAKDLKDKAKALRALDPKADKGKADKDKAKPAKDEKPSKEPEQSDNDEIARVVKMVTEALASQDPKTMREVAAKLRKEGFKVQADSLEAAADEIEASRVKPIPPAPTPVPEPGKPAPVVALVPKRTVTVTSKLNSESRITSHLLGSSQQNRWPELVKVNIPRDADGRNRTKDTKTKNRIGALSPGLQPGQRLFIPDSWKLVTADETRPSPEPKADKPKPTVSPSVTLSTADQLTRDLFAHIVGKTQGQEDTFLVKRWQTAHGRPSDGKYGPGDGLYIAEKYGIAPATPLWWPKKDTAKALRTWNQEMSRLAIVHPDQADEFEFAAAAGKQPGFNAPSGSKVISRMRGDGLGPA
jgi:hypothetical protein